MTGFLKVIGDLVEHAIFALAVILLECRHIHQVFNVSLGTILLGFLDLALHQDLIAEIMIDIAFSFPWHSFHTDFLFNRLQDNARSTMRPAPTFTRLSFPVRPERHLVSITAQLVGAALLLHFFEGPLDFRLRLIYLGS